MAQSTAGTNLVTNCTASAMPAPCVVFKIDTADAGFGNEATWGENASAYVESVSSDTEEHNLEEGAISGGMVCGKATVTLWNGERRYSKDYAAGPLYSAISGGMRGLRVYIGLGRTDATNGDETLPQFSGYIASTTEDDGGRRITVECHDRGWKFQEGIFSGCTALKYDTTVLAYLNTVVALLPAADQPTVSADATLYPIPFAWMDEDNGIQEMGEIAGSQGGSIYFDKEGVLTFKNATAWVRDADSVSSQITFDGDDFGAAFQEVGRQEKATRVIVTYTPRYIATSQDVWQASEVYQVRAGETRTETVKLRNPLYAVIVPAADTDYSAITAGGHDATDDVTVALANTNATKVDVQMTNAGSVAVYVTFLRIRGRPVLPREQLTVETGSSTGEAARIQNLYINSEGHAKSIRDWYYAVLATAKPVYRLQGVPALPWLELRDRITSTYGLGLTTKAFFIVGLHQEWQQGGDYQMAFDLIPADLFTNTDWFVIGTSKLGTGTGKGRAWF